MKTLTRCRTRFRGGYVPVLSLAVANCLSIAGGVEILPGWASFSNRGHWKGHLEAEEPYQGIRVGEVCSR